MYPLRRHAQENPDKPMTIMARSGEVVTYGQLEERANRLAHLFRDAGLKQGDHVAFLLENNVHFAEVCWGAQRAGLYYTAISTHLAPDEIDYIVNDSDSAVFITSYAMRDMATQLVGRMPKVHTALMMNGVVEGYEAYEERVAPYPETPILDEVTGSPMLYSSGTTGKPKGVIHQSIGTSIDEENPALPLAGGLFGLGPDAVYLSPAPLYHAAPMMFTGLATLLGATLVVMEKFDPLEFMSLIEKHKVTTTQVVPTMFIRMLKLPEEQRKQHDLSSMKTCIHAAAPCPIPIKEQMIEWWGPILLEYYGGTERNGLTVIMSQDWLTHKGSVGKSFTGGVHILDDDENELPPGEPGTVYFEGGEEFAYYKDDEKTSESRASKGWSTLGDIGYLDEEGYLYLSDRKADMIISGGVNIYPQEAENVLVTHPKVDDVAVFGIPNEEFGEEVKAVVQPADMAQAGPELEQELLDFCNEKIARLKCPKSIDFEAELPRYPTGKLFKRLLKERYWGDKTVTGISVPKKP